MRLYDEKGKLILLAEPAGDKKVYDLALILQEASGLMPSGAPLTQPFLVMATNLRSKPFLRLRLARAMQKLLAK